jgi:hypothetical protein
LHNKGPIRSKNVIFRKIENEILLLDQYTKQYHILNETAAIIWDLSDGYHTISEITEAICNQYNDTVDVIEEDVIQTLKGLEKLGLINLE